MGGVVNIFYRPHPLTPSKKNLCWGYIFSSIKTQSLKSATVHPTRKNLIFPESLLKADHCEKKLKRGGVPFCFYGNVNKNINVHNQVPCRY